MYTTNAEARYEVMKYYIEKNCARYGCHADDFLSDEGFCYIFSKSISKDREKLHKLFRSSFDYAMTYAYLQGGKAVGFLGIANYRKHSIKVNKDVIIELMGKFGGNMAYKPVSAALENLNTG